MTDTHGGAESGRREYAEALGVLGAHFKHQREAAGLTQAEVAAVIGRTRPTVSNFESGRQDVPLSLVLRMAGAVGLRVTFEPAVLRRSP